MNHNDMPRRKFLADGSKCVALSLAFRPWALAQVSPGTNPFTLGVASGDPLPDGVVLWTRLAPDPLVGGGMPAGKVEVEWQVADDEHMSKIVQRGRATASPDLGHSIHVEVQGLKAARW